MPTDCPNCVRGICHQHVPGYDPDRGPGDTPPDEHLGHVAELEAQLAQVQKRVERLEILLVHRSQTKARQRFLEEQHATRERWRQEAANNA